MKKFILWQQKWRESLRSLGEEGVAAIEYILLTFLVVTTVLSALYQFHDAFKVYANNYFGEYLACLMETGELPQLGYEGEEGECNSSFAEFSLANGRNPIGSGGGGTVGSGGSSSGGNSLSRGGSGSGVSSSTGQNKDSDGGRPERFSSQEGSATDGRAGASGGASGSAYVPIGSNNPYGRAGRQRDNLRKETVENREKSRRSGGGFQNLESNDSFYSDGTNSQSGLRRDFVTAGDAPGEAGGASIAGDAIIIRDSEQAKRRPAKVPIVVKSKSTSQFDDSTPDLAFGDYLRYLIIIAIALALLLFFGSQIQSISKSMDS